MFNFGVQEIVGSKSTTAPGWAYVPDTGINPAVAALQPSSRKRPRTTGPNNTQETSAKQDAKLIRELSALDRDNHRDVSIPVPVRHKENAGRGSEQDPIQREMEANRIATEGYGKVTPGVRRILQSAKTFANHVSDFEAFLATTSTANPSATRATLTTPAQATPSQRPAPAAGAGSSGSQLTSKGSRSHKKKPGQSTTGPSASTPLRQVSTPLDTHSLVPTPTVLDGHILSIRASTVPLHPGDNDPLLISRVPTLPTREEIVQLLACPPLSYLDAKGPLVEEDRRKPARTFCEVCGYWGRIKCKNCGGRVCALECLGVHQEDCFVRYSA